MSASIYRLSCLVLGLALGTVAVSGCDFAQENTQDAMRERLQDRRQLWEEQNIESYRLTYAQQVGNVLTDTVKVFIDDGSVDSVYTAPPISEDELLVGTVESFFDLVEARIGEEGSQFSVDFDEERGFPREYTADFEGRPSQTVLTRSLERLSASSSREATTKD